MNLSQAEAIALKYKYSLTPYCDRIEIAGSIRRQRKEVHDIELVCIPKNIMIQDSLFGESPVRDPAFINSVNSFNQIKGNGEGKYAQIILDEGINLDLFITTPEQWGLIFMIRTGSAQFSKRMVTEIKPYFRVEGGFLLNRAGMILPCYEEKDFFKQTGREYLPPELRVL